jgi:quercetin dioxygenase-like cupin family protein
MSIKPFAVFPENRPRPLNIVGEQLTVLASREATDGYEIFLQDGPSGSGPPPHSHPWDESFYVISGEIEFGVDDEHMTGGAGTLVHVPAGTVHWFRFGTGGGQMISISGAGSRASTLFTEIDAEIPVGPPDVRKLVAVGKRNGVKMIAEP